MLAPMALQTEPAMHTRKALYQLSQQPKPSASSMDSPLVPLRASPNLRSHPELREKSLCVSQATLLEVHLHSVLYEESDITAQSISV